MRLVYPTGVPTVELPVASAGSDQSQSDLSVVTLDGSGSSDPKGGALTYAWVLQEVAADGTLSTQTGLLSDATAQSPTFTPRGLGAVYKAALTVSNADGSRVATSLVVIERTWAIRHVDLTDQNSSTISGTTQAVTDTDSNGVTLTIAQAPNASTFTLSGSGLTITTNGAQASNATSQAAPVVGLEFDDFPDGGGAVPRFMAIELASVSHGGSAGLVWMGPWDEATSSPTRGRCNVNDSHETLYQQTQGGSAWGATPVALGAAPAGLAVVLEPHPLGIFVYAFATATAGEAEALTRSQADEMLAGAAPVGTDWVYAGGGVAQQQFRVGTDSVLLDAESLTAWGLGSTGGSSTVVVTAMRWGSKA